MMQPTLVVTGVSDKLVAMVALVELKHLAEAVSKSLDDPASYTQEALYDAMGAAKAILLSDRAKRLMDDWKSMTGGI